MASTPRELEIEMLGQFLPLFAATDAASGDDGVKRTSSGVPVFPGEEPSEEELRDWLKLSLPILRQSSPT